MSVLAHCIFRTQRIGPLCAHLVKRSCTFLGWKEALASSEISYHDRPPVFTVHKRTLIRKRELIGTSSSFFIKSKYKKDKIDPDFEFVYSSDSILVYTWWTPLAFILIGTIFVLSCKIILDDLLADKQLENVELWLWLDDVKPLDTAYILMPLALSALASVLYIFRSVLLRLYYNRSTNEFIGVTLKYGVYRQKVQFKPSDVLSMEKVKLRGNVLIKGIPARVSEESFKDIEVYNIFMGHHVSRPRKENNEDLMKSLEIVKRKIEKKRADEFVERYKKKRKISGGKNT